MGFLDFFRPLKKSKIQQWKELGTYQSIFSVFGTDAYKSALVRSCIRPLAELTAKAKAYCEDKRIEELLNKRPNMYMNGFDFLQKIRIRREVLNTAFVYIQRDKRLKVIGLYPVPYSYFEAIEYANGLFIKFYFPNSTNETLTLPWEDLAVVRKDYNKSDIAGDDNSSIIDTLQILQTVDEGLKNSIRSTANLRGILKSTKALLAPEHIKAQKDAFVEDYLTLENKGGIASLDSTQEFTPIKMEPVTATSEQRQEFRLDIYRYYGVNDKIILGDLKTEELENFYKIKIAPFLAELSVELSSKTNTSITYMSEQGEFMTVNQKLELFNKVVLYGGMTINEWRSLMGYAGIDGGDTPIRRLDADYINGDEKPRPDNDNGKDEDDGKDE